LGVQERGHHPRADGTWVSRTGGFIVCGRAHGGPRDD
jgi:hypothetical protein